jgi:hypothetical protein
MGIADVQASGYASNREAAGQPSLGKRTMKTHGSRSGALGKLSGDWTDRAKALGCLWVTAAQVQHGNTPRGSLGNGYSERPKV